MLLHPSRFASFVLLIVFLCGCTGSALPRPTATALSATTIDAPTATSTAVPSVTASPVPPDLVATPSSTATNEPALEPSPTAETIDISATVWTSDPVVPAMTFHRFIPLDATNESSTKMSLKTFRTELEMLDEAGFTLVPLAAWLKGDLRVPAGRRPLILTMDDLFFADQIFLEQDGSPSPRSGLGVLWNFSQEHPEFGFSAALFYSLGDKYYGNKQVRDWFNVSDGWEKDLAKAIAWCIEHGAMPYNHFYTHPQLVLMEPKDVTEQLKRNEQRLEKLLDLIHKKDLAAQPDNLIALTYSVWPDSRGSRKAIMSYQSIHGQSVLGVLEADPYLEERYFIKAPYLKGFDPYHIPRIGDRMNVVKALIEEKERFPVAERCLLRVKAQDANNSKVLTEEVAAAVAIGRCPAGVYALPDLLLRADQHGAEPIVLKHTQLPK